MYLQSSGQDEGIGRNPLLPYTAKRRITANLKSINNQKYHKIKLHGVLTTRELKKQLNRNPECGGKPTGTLSRKRSEERP